MHVARLFVYPLKGARAVAVASAAVEAVGLCGDRRWMAVDATGRMVSQRQAPAFARIDARGLVGGGISLACDGHGAVEVARPAPGAPRARVHIWNDALELPLGDAGASAWLSSTLGREVRLVHLPDDVLRAVDPRFGRPGDRVSLADGYPVLLVTDGSLAALAEWVGASVAVDRFRANVVVAGASAFAEDGWQRVRVGSAWFRAVKPCGRCVVTTIDQRTGAGGAEPLATLARLRPGPSGPRFGVNLVPDTGGVIGAGDPVEAAGATS
jgi:uncharacterized protein YcbX